ncbi:MAG TPA: hypothetical protein VMA54_21020 [Steroidobacteraceae bacterium]|nr:hypothetical protein [Steroidobacteraceae bacterium]HUA26625.1 hypothetical protein [Steroidobacteraceae bacterium]
MSKKAISTQRGNARSKRTVLESITGDDALAILKSLAARNRSLAREIEELAKARFSPAEMDVIAANVVMELESLDVEEVWDRSGSNRDEYVEPSEAAWEMFEEALQPFRDEVARFQRLSMFREADLACRGILKGIYDFNAESSSKLKEWAVDAPGEYFGTVLDDWQRLSRQPPAVDSMTEFLKTKCPEWAERAAKSLRRRRR